MVMSTITLLYMINWQTMHNIVNIVWESAQCLTYSTSYFQRLTLERCRTNLVQTPLNRCQQLPAPYKRLIQDKQTKPAKTY